MDHPTWLLLSIALLSSLAFLSRIFVARRCKQLKFAPGPKPWPIIGNLNLIGTLPHRSLHKLSQRYGPLMHLKFGSYSVVIASSAEMAKEFLKKHDQIFASRPKTAAGNPKRLESFEFIRVEEVRGFVSRLYELSGKPVLLREQLLYFTLRIMSRMVLGKRHFGLSGDGRLGSNSILTPREFQEMIDEVLLLNGVFHIGDWIPWLEFLDLQGYLKRMKALKKKLDRFLDHVFEEHKRRK
ncbi:hypothetical protein V6N11_062512 [Hibiscus sabdariffa]|uniref:Uncharacterized protein n=1 Tax=Hibiscus sabdariffa TaxID=183260 RepID=A0ABR2PTC8_9ROSI